MNVNPGLAHFLDCGATNPKMAKFSPWRIRISGAISIEPSPTTIATGVSLLTEHWDRRYPVTRWPATGEDGSKETLLISEQLLPAVSENVSTRRFVPSATWTLPEASTTTPGADDCTAAS